MQAWPNSDWYLGIYYKEPGKITNEVHQDNLPRATIWTINFLKKEEYYERLLHRNIAWTSELSAYSRLGIISLQKTNSVTFSQQEGYTDWGTAKAGEKVPTFAVTGCWVVSATDPYGR
jgi:hypothetical protein